MDDVLKIVKKDWQDRAVWLTVCSASIAFCNLEKMMEQNQRALIFHWYVLLCCIRYTNMYMYPDLTTIHRYGTCVYNFLYRLHILVKQYQSALYLNVTGAGYLVLS